MLISSKNSPRGFSLIEIVLALGVIAFALIGIMGLFPVAMKSAQESMRETRATHIAQQIFSDLRTGTGTNRFVITGPNSTTTNGFQLSTDGTNLFIAYDTNGVPFTTLTASQFSDAYAAPEVAFLAQVTSHTNTGLPNLSQVQATIVAPAVAPPASRSTNTFVTLMNY